MSKVKLTTRLRAQGATFTGAGLAGGANLPPTWITGTDLTVYEGTNYPLIATDPEGDPLSFARTGGTAPPGVVVYSSGIVTGLVEGNYTLTVQVTDNVNVPVSRTFNFTVNAAPVSGDWQLAVGHYMPAKKPMERVFPRPDNNPITGLPETNVWARHRKAYPGILYEIPLGINHGSYPMRFEKISGPTWLSVGERLGVAKYGIAYGTPPVEAAAEQVVIRVYDQEYGRGSSYVDITWSVTVTKSGIIFVDPNAVDDIGTGGTGALGSITNPFKTSRGWYRDDPDDATYAGYHVIWRAGTHALFFDPNSSNPGAGDFSTATKPVVWYAFPGEDACLNFATAQCNVLGAQDWFVADFRIEHSMRKNVQHFWYFYVNDMVDFGTEADSTPTARGYRNTWWRNAWRYHYPSNADKVTYPTKPPSAGENAAAIWTIGAGDDSITSPKPSHATFRWFWYLADNTYQDFSIYDPDTGIELWSDNGCEVSQFTHVYQLVVERNRQVGLHSGGRIGFIKTTCSEITYRANEWWMPNLVSSAPWTVSLTKSYSRLMWLGNVEICWNKIYHNDTATTSVAFYLNASNASIPMDGPCWVYRNTFHGGDTKSAARCGQDFGIWENNVFITKDANAFYLTPPTRQVGSLILNPAGVGVTFDLATGNLLGPTADTYRGTVGHEVY